MKKLKGKFLSMRVTPACLYDLETVELTEQQQLGSSNIKNKEGGQKKDERPEERGWDSMQPNKIIVEKQCEMGRPLGKDEWRQTSKESRGEKTSTIQEKGEATANIGGLFEAGYEKIRGR